jgi:hypothetical protein
MALVNFFAHIYYGWRVRDIASVKMYVGHFRTSVSENMAFTLLEILTLC